jgi:hypothetical protein
MRISKTTGRAAPKLARAKKPARAAKARPRQTAASSAQTLNQAKAPAQLSSLRLAMQRLADGVSKLQAAPLSGTTAQDALAGLRE